MGAAWERHAMCESAYRPHINVIYILKIYIPSVRVWVKVTLN